MDASNSFLIAVDPAFLETVAGSADTMQINQDQRPLREGQVLFRGTYEYLVVPSGSNAPPSIEARPPAQHMMAEKRDKTGKYLTNLPFMLRLESISPEVPGYCEALADGKPGWRIMAAVKHFGPGQDYLLKNRETAWRDPASTPEWQTVRDYITADGTLVKQKWLYDAPGDQIKMKLRDGKENLFRQPNPDKPGTLLVQPSTPLLLPNVQAVVWINTKEEEESVPPPEGSPPDTKPTMRKVTRLQVYRTYECKGKPSVDPSYDKNMCASERKHAQKNPHMHHLVPIEEFQSGARRPSPNAYFYVSMPAYNTPCRADGDPDLVGITLVRQEAVPGDYSGTFNDEPVPNLIIRFNVFQWRGLPHREERYVVKLMCAGQNKDRLSGAFGIIETEPWKQIMHANPEIPAHVEAQLWEKFTVDQPSNAPDVIRASPGMETVRGYYVYGITEIVPDFLRYFTGPRGLKLSREWVLREFSTWHAKNSAGRESMLFTPAPPLVDKVRRNPMNVFDGASGVVVALGNGQLSNPTDPYSQPLYLAYNGEAMTLFTGAHDFYVLISYHMNKEEEATWAGPAPKQGPYADSFVDTLRTAAGLAKKDFHYWIYAVRKDAKRAPAKPLPAVFVRPASPGKRERDESAVPVEMPQPSPVKIPALAVSEQEREGEEEEDEEETYQKTV